MILRVYNDNDNKHTRRKAQSSPLQAARASAINTSVLYVTVSNETDSNGSNRANKNARSTSQISHVGIRVGYGSLLL